MSRFCPQTEAEKVFCRIPTASFEPLFRDRPIRSPVSMTLSGECNAITNRQFGEGEFTFSFSVRELA